MQGTILRDVNDFATTWVFESGKGLLGEVEYRSCSEEKEIKKSGEKYFVVKVLSNSCDDTFELRCSERPSQDIKRGDVIDIVNLRYVLGADATTFQGKITGGKVKENFSCDKLVKDKNNKPTA